MKKGDIITLGNPPQDILELSATETVAMFTLTKKMREEGLFYKGKKYNPCDLIWMGSNKIGILHDIRQ